jgi:uncharacterized membrane protein
VDGRTIAWLSYVPLPGLGVVAALLAPEDRLVRFHAWQGTLLILAGFAAMALLGGLALAVPEGAGRTAFGAAAGLVLVAGVVLLVLGLLSAALGRFDRLPLFAAFAGWMRRD